MKLCDQCKRVLEQFYAWTLPTHKQPILFHGKNMGNGYFTCNNSIDEDSIPHKCIRALIEKLAEQDEKEITEKTEQSRDTQKDNQV